METEKTKVNLEVDKAQLLEKKNSLVVKKKELRAEIAVMNAVRTSNVPVRYQ